MDKSFLNYAGLENINLLLLKLVESVGMIEIIQINYLNKHVKQDHRFIKKIAKPMIGFKAFHSANATITGIKTLHMLLTKPVSEEKIQLKSSLGLLQDSFAFKIGVPIFR